jgi:hypothetical protein
VPEPAGPARRAPSEKFSFSSNPMAYVFLATVPEHNVKVFSKMVQSLAKVGRDITVEMLNDQVGKAIAWMT